MGAITVATAAIGADQQRRRSRVAAAAHPLPPLPNALHRKLCGVRVDPDVHPARILCKIINAVWNRLGHLGVWKVMRENLASLSLVGPFPAGILVVADQFLLLRID